MRRIPTAPIAAASLISGYAVASGTGSRTAGGVVLAAGGLWCLKAWATRNDARTAAILGASGLGAFAVSHVLGLVVGPWPSVLIVSAATAAAAWALSDAHGRADAPKPLAN